MKFLISILLATLAYGAASLDTSDLTKTEEANSTVFEASKKVFGYTLFNGNFKENRQFRYDPNYLLNIGDTISVRIWGAYEFAADLSVDTQGNIFIPRVGTVNMLGVKNNELSATIRQNVRRIFTKETYVYADLKQYQPVSIFVSGTVKQPGLYEGLSSDSVIQFIDKAGGIDPKYGSYRHIRILRNNQTLKEIDLYDFLIYGKMEFFQFRNGDVVFAENIRHYVDVRGDVKRPYRFEMAGGSMPLSELRKAVLPNPTATNAIITKWNERNERDVILISLDETPEYELHSGEMIEFVPDHHSQSIEITIEGEHRNLHTMVVDRGTTLQDVLGRIMYSDLSDHEGIQLFRKSIAQIQKSLLESTLRDLEATTLTTGSVTSEEALIRKQEAQLILNFIDRARKVEPRGQVVLNSSLDTSEIILEEGDTIYIPKKSRMVIIQGEVKLPGAQTYSEGFDFDDYIDSVGGYNFRADQSNVLIIRQNGKVVAYDDSLFSSSPKIMPGDKILVLGKVDSKNLQIVKDITQIVYQVAVGAAVVIRAF